MSWIDWGHGEPIVTGVGVGSFVSDRSAPANQWQKCSHCGEETWREKAPIGFRPERETQPARDRRRWWGLR